MNTLHRGNYVKMCKMDTSKSRHNIILFRVQELVATLARLCVRPVNELLNQSHLQRRGKNQRDKTKHTHQVRGVQVVACPALPLAVYSISPALLCNKRGYGLARLSRIHCGPHDKTSVVIFLTIAQLNYELARSCYGVNVQYEV